MGILHWYIEQSDVRNSPDSNLQQILGEIEEHMNDVRTKQLSRKRFSLRKRSQTMEAIIAQRLKFWDVHFAELEKWKEKNDKGKDPPQGCTISQGEGKKL